MVGYLLLMSKILTVMVGGIGLAFIVGRYFKQVTDTGLILGIFFVTVAGIGYLSCCYLGG